MSAMLNDSLSVNPRLSVALIVPTLNAGNAWKDWLEAYQRQTLRPMRSLVVDSSSKDHTRALAADFDFQVIQIPKEEFNHGGTRQFAIGKLPSTNIVVFMTQDAILATPQSIARLVAVFSDDDVGAAFGRQLPKSDSTPVAAHARLFNYPPESHLRSIEDAPRFGFKTAFLSNSFAAYRRSALEAVGGFPTTTIMNEDAFVAAKMLLAGRKVAYVSDAVVFHSHNYSLVEEFRRYFDIGVFHARESWIRQRFGAAEGEGARFIRSELRFLMRTAPMSIPSSIARAGLKYLGYRLGRIERLLNRRLKEHLSMHRDYWRGDNAVKRSE